MEIGRTYQFRPSKDSEGDPKNEAKKRLVKCFFFLKKKNKKIFSKSDELTNFVRPVLRNPGT